MPSKIYLILRSAQRARLEGRTLELQCAFGRAFRLNAIALPIGGGSGGLPKE